MWQRSQPGMPCKQVCLHNSACHLPHCATLSFLLWQLLLMQCMKSHVLLAGETPHANSILEGVPPHLQQPTFPGFWNGKSGVAAEASAAGHEQNLSGMQPRESAPEGLPLPWICLACADGRCLPSRLLADGNACRDRRQLQGKEKCTPDGFCLLQDMVRWIWSRASRGLLQTPHVASLQDMTPA